jgi:hypothetical protein
MRNPRRSAHLVLLSYLTRAATPPPSPPPRRWPAASPPPRISWRYPSGERERAHRGGILYWSRAKQIEQGGASGALLCRGRPQQATDLDGLQASAGQNFQVQMRRLRGLPLQCLLPAFSSGRSKAGDLLLWASAAGPSPPPLTPTNHCPSPPPTPPCPKYVPPSPKKTNSCQGLSGIDLFFRLLFGLSRRRWWSGCR